MAPVKKRKSNVWDRGQNNFPSKRLARHKRLSTFLRIDDTFSASRGTDRFNLLQKIIRASNSSRFTKLDLTVHLSRPVIMAVVEFAHVVRYCRRSDCPKRRNTDCACSRSLSIRRNLSQVASGLIHSDDSQIDRSSSSSRHESRNYCKGHPGGPAST
jgi:hypothetical protein